MIIVGRKFPEVLNILGWCQVEQNQIIQLSVSSITAHYVQDHIMISVNAILYYFGKHPKYQKCRNMGSKATWPSPLPVLLYPVLLRHPEHFYFSTNVLENFIAYFTLLTPSSSFKAAPELLSEVLLQEYNLWIIREFYMHSLLARVQEHKYIK